MFQAINVSKAFGEHLALEDISLTIPANAVTSLIGPSGSGKSTLVRLFLGFLAPTSGELLFKGKPVSSYPPIPFKQNIGLVVQSGGLFPHLTAEENVSLIGITERWPKAMRKERVLKLAEQCRLSPNLLSRFPSELSGGQIQRVSLMRALFLNPEILVLDEPFSALDPLIRRELQEDLKRLFSDLKKTVILVTHDLPEAAFFSEKIALLKGGRLVQFDSYGNLASRPADAFVSEFLNAYRPLETKL